MTRSKSENPSKTPADIAARYPEIPSIESSIEEIEDALISLSFDRWVSTDVEFANLGERVIQLRSETFALIDRLEPLVFVDGRPDGVVSRLYRYLGNLLGRLNQLADDMSIPAQGDMISDIIGVDIAPTLAQLNERSAEIKSALDSLDADEGPTEIAHTLESIFRDTFDWLDGLLIMYSSQLAETREKLRFFEQQLNDENTPEETRDIVLGINLARTKIREYEKGLTLAEEIYQSLRTEERRFRRKYQDPSQLSDDDYLDLDDGWG